MQSQPEDMKSTSAPARMQWNNLFKILLAVVLIGIVFSKTSVGQIIELSRNVSWSWLLISFLLFCLTTAFKAVQYWALLGYKLRYSQIVKIVVFQNALSNLVANTAGVASFFTMFRVEQNVDFKRSGVIFMVTKVSDLFSMGAFLLISSLLVWKRITDLHQITLILLAGITVALTVFMAVIILRSKFVLLVERVIRWLRLDRFKIVESGLKLIQSLAEQDRMVFVRMFLLTTSLSMVYMTATMLYYYSKVQIFHIPIDFWASVYIISIFQLISIIPFQVFGGLGVIEFTMMFFYTTVFGVVYADLPAALIGGRILSYLFILTSLLYGPLDMMISRLRPQNKS